MAKKFLRRIWMRYSKLGKGKKKKQKWRKPKGRDNKMREKRRGYPKTVSIGYGNNKKTKGKIENKKPIIIYNVEDIAKIKPENIAIIGRIGKRKKAEIVKIAEERKIKIYNLNIKKFLKKQIKAKKSKENKK
jgi:large subunit ribosomal protein L32e